MTKLVRVLQFGIMILVFHGCSSGVSHDTSQWTPTVVTDFKNVAGTWEGLLRGVAGPRADEDWIRLTIAETGIYEFATYRTIGVFSGKGKFNLVDGRLTAQSDKGQMSVQLFRDAANGERMLQADAATSNGQKYSARLKRTSAASPTAK